MVSGAEDGGAGSDARPPDDTTPAAGGRPRARLFVALLLPDRVRSGISDAVAPLRDRFPEVRWTRTGQLHLTLRFIGDVARPRVAAVGEALERALAGRDALALALDGGGAFPSPARASVLWVGVRADDRLADVQAAVERAVTSVGIPPDPRPFHPHVTIGRIRARGGGRPAGLAVAGLELSLEAPVREVSLMESVLGSAGARHTRVAAVPLGAD